MTSFTESVVEEAALAWLERLGFAVLHGPEITVGMPGAERTDPGYRDVVLERRLRQPFGRLNPSLPPEALDDAFRKLTRADAPSLIERNRAAHRMLVDGVTVEYRRPDGSIAGAQARVIDFDVLENDDWLAVTSSPWPRASTPAARTSSCSRSGLASMWPGGTMPSAPPPSRSVHD